MMRAKRIGVSESLDIRIYAFTMPFDLDLFTAHMTRRTARLFIEAGAIGQRYFVAVTAADFETQAPTPTLSIIIPKWHATNRDKVYADVREYLARSDGIAVSSISETEHGVTVSVECKGQRNAFAATKIRAGRLVALGAWERVGVGVALPLLPPTTTPGNLQ